MKNYIFLTSEGYTFQPNSEGALPDVENLQALGFAEGKSQEEAFRNLIEDNAWIKETSFREIFCYQLDDNFEKSDGYFDLRD